MRDLPSFNLLATFEAAARHLSFTQAASELNVLQPAVSRQIAALEEHLGVALFLRTKPRLSLTTEGQLLHGSVTAGLAQLRSGMAAVAAQRERRTLVVNTSAGFASCYLMARLARFTSANPDVDLQLVTFDQNRRFGPLESDIVVMFGRDDLPGVGSRRVLPDQMIAVCAPSLLPDGRQLEPDEIVRHRLLHLRDPLHETDWEVYLEGTDVAPPAPGNLDWFNSYLIYLQAALNGDGIAIGWRGLMDDMLNTGQLRLASERTVSAGRGYHACVLERGRDNPEAWAFVDWLSGLDGNIQ